MRKLYKKLFSDGVMPNPSTNMQVSAGTGMNVTVAAGFAICNGCLKLEESSRTLAIQASESAYDRIDTVVLRLNDNYSARICDFYVLKGTPATSPIRPALTQTESIWEIGLADLFIAKNSTGISNQRITDTRYETARCGVISSISQFDTTTLYNQIQADLASFQDVNEAEFLAWFDEMKDQLSEDAAGNLQNEIDQTRSMLSDAYSAAKSYAVGDYCIHDNTLYKCNTAISSEAWTEAHWTETSISSENVALTNSIALLTNKLNTTDINLNKRSHQITKTEYTDDGGRIILGIPYNSFNVTANILNGPECISCCVPYTYNTTWMVRIIEDDFNTAHPNKRFTVRISYDEPI